MAKLVVGTCGFRGEVFLNGRITVPDRKTAFEKNKRGPC